MKKMKLAASTLVLLGMLMLQGCGNALGNVRGVSSKEEKLEHRVPKDIKEIKQLSFELDGMEDMLEAMNSYDKTFRYTKNNVKILPYEKRDTDKGQVVSTEVEVAGTSKKGKNYSVVQVIYTWEPSDENVIRVHLETSFNKKPIENIQGIKKIELVSYVYVSGEEDVLGFSKEFLMEE